MLSLPFLRFRDGGRAEADGDGRDVKEPPGGLAKVIHVDNSAVTDVGFLLHLRLSYNLKNYIHHLFRDEAFGIVLIKCLQ